MTNAQIIFQNRVFLMEHGLLKGVEGQMITWTDEEGTREIQMPEEIHTFQTWKSMGYQVQKGEHAVAKFPVWKFKASKKKGDEQEAGDDEEPQTGRCFMKVAFFFTADQVKPIEEKGSKAE